jgi:aminoglycoside phosphotransferase (APT) family kinase protein
MTATHTRSHYRVERNLDEGLTKKMARRAQIERSSGLGSPSEAQRRLERFLRTRVAGEFAVTDVARLSGGGANESYSFVLEIGDRREERVLRIKAPGAICETDVEREFHMLLATRRALPVPEPYWWTTDPDDFGAPALICQKVDGVASPTKNAPKATGLGVAFGAPLAEKLAPQFVRHLAALHSYDWSTENLGGFDIPRADTTDAVDWRLDFWDRAWEEDALEAHPTVLLTQQWLRERRPFVDHVSLLHGDYRNGNFLFDEDTTEITAVIDWELCYLGDRHSDLGYAMLPGWGHFTEDGRYLNSGLVEKDRFIADYERHSGLDVDQERLEYYLVLNMYWAVVALVGTGVRNAEAKMTQLDVMYNFISGLGGFFIGELNRVLAKD